MSRRRWAIVAGLFVVLILLPLSDGAVLTGARGVSFTVCSQLPSHSFFVDGQQLPLCARCTGIYLGFLAGLAGMALLGKLGARLWPPRTVMAILLLSLAAMVGDGFNSLTSSLPEAVQVYEPTNLLRLITGIAAGTSLALLEIPLLNGALWAKRDMTESVSDLSELLGSKVMSHAGNILGNVEDVEVEPSDLSITGYDLGKGALANLFGGRMSLPAAGIHYGEFLMVPDEVIAQMEPAKPE